MSTDPANLDPIPGEELPWEAGYEPLQGLLADFLDFACASSDAKVAQAYCYLADAALGPRKTPDECMAVCAGQAVVEVAKALTVSVEFTLGRPVALTSGQHGYDAHAASLCVRLVALMIAAGGPGR